MAGIGNVLGTTFNLPNFVGEMFGLSPTDTPFLAMSGGLTGGRPAVGKMFNWQDYDLPTPAQPAIVEGADPVLDARVRAERSNCVQIFQYGVKLSYTDLAARGQVANTVGELANQPVQNEMTFQLGLKIKTAKRDVEYSFLQGSYQYPTDNTTGRKTRGILAAVSTTNVAASSAALASTHFDSLFQGMYDQGAPFENVILFMNSFQKLKTSGIYAYAPQSRNVGGVNIQSIETDFGVIGVMLDRFMPTGTILAAEMSVVAPRFLPIPEKGHFFLEPLAKTGAAETAQLYGEIGLEYGPEIWHGKITGLATS